MNLFIGILALIVCTVIGYRLSAKYTAKKNFYSDFYDFNKALKGEVSFAQKTIKDLIKNGAAGKGEFFNVINQKFFEKSEDFTVKSLSAEQTNFLKNYLNTIGQSDRSTQLKYLDNAESAISQNLSESTEDEKKYKTLYVKLGFLFGLIILIALL